MVKGQKSNSAHGQVRNLGELRTSNAPSVRSRVKDSVNSNSVSSPTRESILKIKALSDKNPPPVAAREKPVTLVSTKKNYILCVFTDVVLLDQCMPIIKNGGFEFYTMCIVDKAENATTYDKAHDVTFYVVDTRCIGLDNEVVARELAAMCTDGIVLIIRKPLDPQDDGWMKKLSEKVILDKDINNECFRCFISERYQ